MENLPPPCARAEPSVHLACPLRPGCSGLWGGAREMGRPPTPAPGRTQASAEHSLAGPVERDKGEPTGAWRAGGWGGCCWVDLAAAGQPAESGGSRWVGVRGRGVNRASAAGWGVWCTEKETEAPVPKPGPHSPPTAHQIPGWEGREGLRVPSQEGFSLRHHLARAKQSPLPSARVPGLDRGMTGGGTAPCGWHFA